MGIVTQETILFNDTISGNIAYGQNEIELTKIAEAAKVANAKEFINDLPHGFDTVIGEKGVRLSGGQRQRLAIARALLKDPPILILDEATSAVDPETEVALVSALDQLSQGRTTISVAHRLSTAERSDMVIVFDKGHIVEIGSHHWLSQQDGVYANLYKSWIGNTQSV